MITGEKKRLQIKLDKQLDQNVSLIFERLGLNPTVVINALYKRIEAEGKIPFEFGLTREEKDNLALMNTINNHDFPLLNDEQEIADYLLGDADDEEY